MSLSSIALALFIFFTSMADIGRSLVGLVVTGIIGLVYCVLWALAAFGVYNGTLPGRHTN